MSEEQKKRLEELWGKCCDLRQPMSSEELGELGELLGLAQGEEEEEEEEEFKPFFIVVDEWPSIVEG